jgi:hypothetical protein
MSQVPVTELTEAGLPRPSTMRFALLMLMICATSVAFPRKRFVHDFTSRLRGNVLT